MKNLMIDNLKAKLITDARLVNHYADNKDVNRNHVNYGCVIAYADVLRTFGISVDVQAYGDNEYLRIPRVQIDSRVVRLEEP